MAAINIPKSPLARLRLMPPHPDSSVCLTLEIREANAQTIQVFDPTDNPDHPVARYFDLKTHRFVLRYATDSERSGWKVEINGDSPQFSITYAFLDRKAASKFQKYVTGYDPEQYEVGENIQCDASIKRDWLLGCDTCSGIGEIQLWVPFYGPSDENFAVDTPWETALVPRVVRQPNSTPTNTTFAVVGGGRVPLIVMFLREIGTDRRTMLRMNPLKVKWRFEQKDRMEILVFDHPDDKGNPFRARRCSVPKEDIKKWDVCALARKAPDKTNGVDEITIASLTLKIRRVPPPHGTPEPLSRLGHFVQQLDRLRKTLNGAMGPAQQARRLIERGIPPTQILASGAFAGDASRTLVSARTVQMVTAIPTATRSRFVNSRDELPGDNRPRQSLEGAQTPTEMESSTRSPSSLVHYPPIERKPSISISMMSSPNPGSARAGPYGASGITAVYPPGYHGSDTRPDAPRTPAKETPPRLYKHASEVSADSSDDDNAADSLFTNFDDRVRRALQAEPSISSVAENTISRLHTLPGELRALVYDFPTGSQFEGFPETADRERASLASRSATSSNRTSGKLFRCPFNVANPREHWRGGCKGPGFPLSRLGDHLERCHLSYECLRCGTDCGDDDGLVQHACKFLGQIQRAAVTGPASLSDKISDAQLRRIKAMLKPSSKGKIRDEDQWFQMWGALFPGSAERPEPYFAPRAETEGVEFRRVEIVFEAMVDSDGGGVTISKAKTKLYLQAAIKAVEGQGLERWPLN